MEGAKRRGSARSAKGSTAAGNLRRHCFYFLWQFELRTSPTCSAADERHTQSARYKTENGRFIHRLLNDLRRFQASAKTLMHQAVVVGQAFPPRKPHKRSIAQ